MNCVMLGNCPTVMSISPPRTWDLLLDTIISRFGNSQDVGVSMRGREVAHICGKRFGMRTFQLSIRISCVGPDGCICV